MLTSILPELVAIVGGTVHTMVPGEVPQVATVLVEDGVVRAIAPELALPAGTMRYDASGKHVVPGLIDALVHFDAEHDALYVAHGVTVVRDVGGSRVKTQAERDPAARDRTPGPALYTCGAVLDGDPPGSPDAAILRSPAAAQSLLPILIDERVDFLCVQLGLGAEAWTKVLEIAHAAELDVWGPVPRALSIEAALEGGQDGIHHLDRFLPTGVSWEVVSIGGLTPQIEALAASNVPLVPTMHASALRLVNQSETPVMGLLPLLDPTYESWWRGELAQRASVMTEETQEQGARIVAKQRSLLFRLLEGGVRLVPGSGAPHPWLFPGQALHTELALWVESGMAPADALHAATRGAAEALGLGDVHGSLAVGRSADLVVTATDPREDLSGLAAPELVGVRGRILERTDLDDLLQSVAVRQQKAREALDLPLEVDPPELPDGALVLSGLVESRSVGRRLAVERFAVVRLPDGGLALCGRLRYAEGVESEVRQVLRDGLLDELDVRSVLNGRMIEVRGEWTAERFRVRRTVEGVVLDTQSMRDHPLLADLSSITSLLAIGQRDAEGEFPVMTFHEAYEPEAVRWRAEVQDDGDYIVDTHTARMAFRFDEKGAPLKHRQQVGQGIVETKLLEVEAYGGSGLPAWGLSRRQ